jgi:hypothetical protein
MNCRDRDEREPPRGFGGSPVRREQSDKIFVGEERAEFVPQEHVGVAAWEGGAGDAGSLGGDGRHGLRA